MTSSLVPTTSAAPDLRLPSPVDKTALKSYLALIEDKEALELQSRLATAYDTACKALLGKNDIQVEGKGENAREFKKKSAWRKLGRYFGVATSVVDERHEILEGEFIAICTVRGVAPWGQSADAIGACSTDEETGRRKITIADAIATAQTRAMNRAISDLIAMGEVSAEEIGSRDLRDAMDDAAAEEMTLEQAKAFPFPWKKPPKYAGQPMSALSENMVNNVKKAIDKEIAEKGKGPTRVALQRVCELLLDDFAYQKSRAGGTPAAEMPDSEDTIPAVDDDEDESTRSSAPADLRLAPDVVDPTAPLASNSSASSGETARAPHPESVEALVKRLREIVDSKHEGEFVFPADFRGEVKRAIVDQANKPTYHAWLLEQVDTAGRLRESQIEQISRRRAKKDG